MAASDSAADDVPPASSPGVARLWRMPAASDRADAPRARDWIRIAAAAALSPCLSLLSRSAFSPRALSRHTIPLRLLWIRIAASSWSNFPPLRASDDAGSASPASLDATPTPGPFRRTRFPRALA